MTFLATYSGMEYNMSYLLSGKIITIIHLFQILR